MEKQKLQELLEQLHGELEQTETVDEATGEVLSTLREDIGRLVRDDAPIGEEHESLSRRLDDAVGHFEEDHPKLSMAIQHVLDSLARMGF